MSTPTTQQQTHRSQRPGDLLLIGCFCLALALPLADNLFGLDPTAQRQPGEAAEWQQLAEPAASPRAWVTRAKQLLSERMGFRESLIRWQATVKVVWLGASSNPEVALGKDGWLFLQGTAMEAHRNLSPFNRAELGGTLGRIERQRRWLAARGIHYVFVPVPNKHTIYPDYVPDSAQALHPESRLSALLDVLRDRHKMDAIDLRPALAAARTDGMRVYHKLDSHWNELGAWVAYRQILARLSQRWPALAARKLKEFDVTWRPREGDLARMLGLRDVLREESPKLVPRFQARGHVLPSGEPTFGYVPGYLETFVSSNGAADAPRALVLRDSFADALVPFLAEHFSQTGFVWHDTLEVVEHTSSFLERWKPDVVIHLFSERVLEGI